MKMYNFKTTVMRRITVLTLLILIGVAGVAQRPVFRWDVKTATDSSGIDWVQKLEDARDNHFATIEGLTKKKIAFNSCHDVGKNTRRPDEKRVVRMRIKLIKVKKEANDDDYHIVMQSLTNGKNKMVAEVPDPGIEELEGSEFSELRGLFTAVRAKVEELLGDAITQSFKNFPPNTVVIIYGVPFYDCKHGGAVLGASKNFRELHPVMEIEEE